jgi:hypothetical protein
VDESVFQGTFRVFVLEAKELENHRVFDFFLGCREIVWNGTLGFF